MPKLDDFQEGKVYHFIMKGRGRSAAEEFTGSVTWDGGGGLMVDLNWASDSEDVDLRPVNPENVYIATLVKTPTPEEAEDEPMTPERAILWLESMADGEEDQYARDCSAIAGLLRKLSETGGELVRKALPMGGDPEGLAGPQLSSREDHAMVPVDAVKALGKLLGTPY
jgi:hypothetical protein